MKRFFTILLAVAMCLLLAACGSSGSQSSQSPNQNEDQTQSADPDGSGGEWIWERDIEMVCMYDVGSGTDATLRAICDQVGKELGINIVINNVSGGSGLNGAEYLYTQPNDGYTYGMLGISHVLAGLKGTSSFDMKNEMTAVCCLVQDNEMVFANVDLPFSDWEGLEAYAKEHPGELTLCLTSINGVDAASVQQLFDEAGLDIKLVAADSSEQYSMVIGGHVNMTLGSPNECLDYVNAGQLIPLITINTVRSTALPEVPCSADFGYTADIGPWRAIFARTGTPEAAIASLDAAFQKVMNSDPAWAEFKELNGLNDRPAQRTHEEMQEYWLKQFDDLASLVEE